MTDIRKNSWRTAAVLLLGLFPFWPTPCTQASGSIMHVNASNATPSAPFSTWATAATNIQDAIDAAADGDTVLVTNGVYATGGRAVYGTMTNRVAVDKAVVLQSVNGPEVTVITGQTDTRCVYLTNGAALSGFTLTNGATRVFGGPLPGAKRWRRLVRVYQHGGHELHAHGQLR